MNKTPAKRSTISHHQRRPKPAPTAPKSSGFGWMFLGVVLGVGLAGLMYIKSTNTPPSWWVVIQERGAALLASHHPHPAAHHAKTDSTSPAQPHFDFYTALPSSDSAGQLVAAPEPVTKPKPVVAVTVTKGTTAANATTPAVLPSPTVANNSKILPAPTFNEHAHVAALPTSTTTPVAKITTAPVIAATKPAPHYILQLATVSSMSAADKMKAEMGMMGIMVKVVERTGHYHVVLGPYKSKQTALSVQQKLLANNVKTELKPTA